MLYVSQELTWQVLHNFDKEGAKENIHERTPFVEYQTFFSEEKKESLMAGMGPEDRAIQIKSMAKTIENANEMKSPRLIRSHLPLSMLPPNLLDTCKVVYVCRNPKDNCVSYYHHTQDVFGFIYDYADSFENFEKYYRKGQVMYGNYWYHLKV